MLIVEDLLMLAHDFSDLQVQSMHYHNSAFILMDLVLQTWLDLIKDDFGLDHVLTSNLDD